MAIQAVKTIQEILHKEKWSAGHLLATMHMNKLLQSGLTTKLTPADKAMLQYVDWNNAAPQYEFKIAQFVHAEMSIPTPATADDIVSLSAQYSTQKVIPYVRAQALMYQNLEAQIEALEGNAAAQFNAINAHAGDVISKMLNDSIAKILANLSLLPEITVGSNRVNFSEELVDKAREKLGESGFARPLGNLFMNSKTIGDILAKQSGGTITSRLIEQPQTFGINAGGIVANTANTATWAYKGSTPVWVDDSMPDGLISIVNDGAFLFGMKEKSEGMFGVERSEKSFGGGGSTEIVLRAVYVLHPNGFSATGTKGPGATQSHEFGPTHSQLSGATPLFETIFDAKYSRIMNIKVKLGG